MIAPQQLTLRYVEQRPNSKVSLAVPKDILPILAIDPGGVTGWSLLVLNRIEFGQELLDTNQEVLLNKRKIWRHGEIDCRTDEFAGVYQLKKLIDEWWFAAVVIESFFIRQRALDLSPARITAIIEDHLWQMGKKAHFQQASQAKTTCTDDRLKLWGAYTSEGGLGHARDADRHALLFMRRCIKSSLKELAWPAVYGSIA